MARSPVAAAASPSGSGERAPWHARGGRGQQAADIAGLVQQRLHHTDARRPPPPLSAPLHAGWPHRWRWSRGWLGSQPCAGSRRLRQRRRKAPCRAARRVRQRQLLRRSQAAPRLACSSWRHCTAARACCSRSARTETHCCPRPPPPPLRSCCC
jgi:hypothetical protein